MPLSEITEGNWTYHRLSTLRPIEGHSFTWTYNRALVRPLSEWRAAQRR
jgi:hypothetical protein